MTITKLPTIHPWITSHSYAPDERGCRLWRGFVHAGGYGMAWVPGGQRKTSAHRVAYELTHGPIPRGLLVRHVVCHRRRCIEPTHLALGTHQQNMDDMVAAGRSSRTLSDEDVYELRVRRAAGETITSLARHYKVSRSLVSELGRGLHRAYVGGPLVEKRGKGGPRAPRWKISDEDIPVVLARLARGEPRVAIAADLGVHPRTLTARLAGLPATVAPVAA